MRQNGACLGRRARGIEVLPSRAERGSRYQTILSTERLSTASCLFRSHPILVFLVDYWSDVLEFFAFDQIAQLNAHRVPACLADLAHTDPNHLTARGNEHYLIGITYGKSSDNGAGTVPGSHGDDPFASPGLNAILVESSAFPNAV